MWASRGDVGRLGVIMGRLLASRGLSSIWGVVVARLESEILRRSATCSSRLLAAWLLARAAGEPDSPRASFQSFRHIGLVPLLLTVKIFSDQMAASTEPVPQTLPAERPDAAMLDDPMNGARTVPIIETSAPSPGDPMEITSPTSSSAPQSATKSPEIEIKVNGSAPSQPAPSTNTSPSDSNSSSNAVVSSQAPAPAAPAVHQPKIVQTAFIHKLYKYVRLLLV